MRINFNEPRFDENDLKSVEEVIKNNFVNEGPKTKELEEKLKEILNIKNIILVPNATAALFLAIKTESILRNIKDFEVIIPGMTMFATATATEWAGGKPVLVDVQKETGLIDTNKIQEKINEKTIAIIPVHILGRGANMEKIQRIARENNIAIIEDAAGALGSKQNGKYLGTLGDVGCFSLQSNKIITCGQGGIIATNNPEKYEVMKRLRDFGRFNKEFLHEKIGFNLKFSDLQAALALSQLEKLEIRKNLLLEQYLHYKNNLKNLGKIKFFEYKEGEIPLWIDVVCENREELIEFLKENEIYPRPCWPAIHENPPYKNYETEENFSNSSYFSKNVLWIPNGPAITKEQINLISKKILEFYNKMELNKIHEDKRGYIYLVKNLLEDEKEFTFLEVKKGAARGGCIHSKDEYFVVIKGKIKYVLGDKVELVSQGESRKIPAGFPHAFIGMEDSIVSEWGITSQEKASDKKDPEMRRQIDKLNESLY